MGTNFFDFKEEVAAKAKRARSAPSAKPQAAVAAALTVSQLTAQVDRLFQNGFPEPILVRGEVSNYRPNASSGHVYFTLKDAGACLNCVMFRSSAEKLRFAPTDGMELLARGSMGVYFQQGKYQLNVTSLQPLGQGALELAFQQMRAKLEAEGLFETDRKRPLPKYPTRIVLITSSQTAALQDMLKVLRRFPWLRLFVYHVPVQGEGCGKRIAEGLAHVNQSIDSLGGADVILLGRGGGSLEDLWGFNEEAVARTVAKSRIPVVTGIGHEVDTSIADLVADYHAHTPTEAAQVVTAHWRGARDAVTVTITRLLRSVRAVVHLNAQRLLACERHEVFRRPMYRIDALRQVLDERQQALAHKALACVRRKRDRLAKFDVRLAARHPRIGVALAKEKLAGMARHLNALAPDQVLARGYSITTRKRDGKVVREPDDVRAGDKIVTRVAKGQVESVVDDGSQAGLFE